MLPKINWTSSFISRVPGNDPKHHIRSITSPCPYPLAIILPYWEAHCPWLRLPCNANKLSKDFDFSMCFDAEPCGKTLARWHANYIFHCGSPLPLIQGFRVTLCCGGIPDRHFTDIAKPLPNSAGGWLHRKTYWFPKERQGGMCCYF